MTLEAGLHLNLQFLPSKSQPAIQNDKLPWQNLESNQFDDSKHNFIPIKKLLKSNFQFHSEQIIMSETWVLSSENAPECFCSSICHEKRRAHAGMNISGTFCSNV